MEPTDQPTDQPTDLNKGKRHDVSNNVSDARYHPFKKY